MKLTRQSQIDALVFGPDGLIPVVTQDSHTGEVLMVAWSNRDSLERTLTDRRMWYWSRSRSALWRKGDQSGNYQVLVSLHADCDGDVLLALVEPAGPSCHTGARTCFDAGPVIAALGSVIRSRASGEPAAATDQPERGYTRRLLDDENLRLKKLGEEAIELALACRSDDRARIASEAADLVYHILVACTAAGVSEVDVLGELGSRLRGPDERAVSRS